MKVLNLVNKETSEIKYEVSNFPDGQSQVKIVSEFVIFKELSKGHDNDIKSHAVQIKARLNNFKDLELIICTIASLRGLGVKEIHLYVPYFLGSRSDRKFEDGSNNYLKDIICPIINSLKLDSITVLDPHSDVLEACLDNFKKVGNINIIDWSLTNIYNNKSVVPDWESKCLLISPDAGASKKIYKVAEAIGYKGEVITCSKDRDTDGNLTKTLVPCTLEDPTKDFIIIDDICDGGATFINIAKVIKQKKHIGKLYLIVTHGIFSKGIMELNQHFDAIYCTNSYSTLNKDKFGNNTKDFIKQLNVF